MNARDNLRRLRAHVAKPTLVREHGVAMVVSDGLTTQFHANECAEFYVAAWTAVPALLDELEELERRQAPGLVDKMVEEIAALKRTVDQQAIDIRALERRNLEEVLKRTNAVRNLRELARNFAELKKKVQSKMGGI